MRRYVVGFIFSDDLKEVLLMKKRRPTWQIGKLNGLGGRVEVGEHAVCAMTRAANEEALIEVPPSLWQHVMTLRFHEDTIEVFAMRNSYYLNKAQAGTDEELVVNNGARLGKLVPNTLEMISMSINHLKG